MWYLDFRESLRDIQGLLDILFGHCGPLENVFVDFFQRSAQLWCGLLQQLELLELLSYSVTGLSFLLFGVFVSMLNSSMSFTLNFFFFAVLRSVSLSFVSLVGGGSIVISVSTVFVSSKN